MCYITLDASFGRGIGFVVPFHRRRAMQHASIEVPGDYSARVRSLRGCIELSQTQLAKRVGVSFASVNRWENGQSKPTRLAWRQILDLEAENPHSQPGV